MKTGNTAKSEGSCSNLMEPYNNLNFDLPVLRLSGQKEKFDCLSKYERLYGVINSIVVFTFIWNGSESSETMVFIWVETLSMHLGWIMFLINNISTGAPPLHQLSPAVFQSAGWVSVALGRRPSVPSEESHRQGHAHLGLPVAGLQARQDATTGCSGFGGALPLSSVGWPARAPALRGRHHDWLECWAVGRHQTQGPALGPPAAVCPGRKMWVWLRGPLVSSFSHNDCRFRTAVVFYDDR